MRVADEEELEASGVEARVHLQLDGPGRGAGTSDRTKRAPHVECGPRGPLPVIVAVVQEEESIASELEQAAALLVRDLEECRERRIHHVRHFLRARAPEAGRLLGHGREAGDVDERQRPFELQPVLLGAGAQPLEGQTWDKRDEVRPTPRRVGWSRATPSGGFSSTGVSTAKRTARVTSASYWMEPPLP